MADVAGVSCIYARRARGHAPGADAASMLPAIMLAFPAAVCAAAATLLAGGGILGAAAAYGVGGAVALLAGALALAAPWRRLARPVRRWTARLAAGAAVPTQLIGR